MCASILRSWSCCPAPEVVSMMSRSDSVESESRTPEEESACTFADAAYLAAKVLEGAKKVVRESFSAPKANYALELGIAWVCPGVAVHFHLIAMAESQISPIVYGKGRTPDIVNEVQTDGITICKSHGCNVVRGSGEVESRAARFEQDSPARASANG
eukprot:2997430-Rhodomonas_salina.1